MLVTFKEAFVTELILASTVHDPLHLTAEGLGFIWLLGLIQQALLILCTLRKAAVVKVFWSNCVSRFRASVTSAACYVSVSGQMPFEQLSSYSTLQTPDGFYKHCTPA